MRNFDADLVLGARSWNEFLSRHTDLKYLHQSKMLRIMTLSKLNGKRQASCIGQIMLKMYESMTSSNVARHEEFVCRTNDEFILKIEPEESQRKIDEISKWIQTSDVVSNFREFVKVEVFKLKKLGKYEFFVKEISIPAEKIEFKAVSPAYFAQAYKFYRGLPIVPMDLKIDYEGHVATFDHPVF